MSRRIYPDLNFKPKIWGMYFNSLFTVLGGFVLGIMVMSLAGDMVTAFLLNSAVFGGLTVVFFIRDNRDEAEYRAKRSGVIKKRLSPYVLSDQRVRMAD